MISKTIFKLLIVFPLLFNSFPCRAQSVSVLSDTFDSLSSQWHDIYLKGSTGGTKSIFDGLLILKSITSTEFGVYNSTPVSGNFYTEIEFSMDDAVGLALVKNNGGVPDTSNYTMIAVTNRAGKVYVDQFDKQNGIANVHDPKNIIPDSRYWSKLDGSVFSVPYKNTNGKIRILHEALSGTFHFYYGTRLIKDGITSNDWLELAPQYSWLPLTQEYFVALVCRNENSTSTKQIKFDYVNVVKTPITDLDDKNTGFKAVKREFHWSGFSGDAVVVSFGNEFAFTKDIKFVFWDRANNAPMWRLNNQYMMSWEFGERRYSDGKGGCAEAMSDRQRHGQVLEILEDNDVRKVVRWRGTYYLPHYNFPGEGYGGTQIPYYEEYWTFYPDGVATRRFVDVPKLDSDKNGVWPEFLEGIPIGGTLVDAGDLCNSPALSILNLTGNVNNYLPGSAFNSSTYAWDQVIFNAHFKGGNPDLFIAYNQADDVKDTWAGYKPLEGEISWHSPSLNFSHWPVGREPYGQNTDDKEIKSMGMMKNEVTSAALMSAGFYGAGQDWASNFKVNSDGRKYREYVMLSGAVKANDYNTVKDHVQTWLYPGTVAMIDNNSTFIKNNYTQRELVFQNINSIGSCNFNFTPGTRSVRNPSFRIDNWAGTATVIVKINDAGANFKSALVNGSLLIWVNATISAETKFEISDNSILSVNPTKMETFDLKVFPNPSHASSITVSLNLLKADTVRLAVFDAKGQEIEVLENTFLTAGMYNYRLKSKLANGVYFLHFNSTLADKTIQMIVE